ncbi:MAG: CDGSH iron-sulfur domain-containing protein [Brucellaceae bacterium]|nr:CDGSH iron-sulfur domain-containing protein [Brucellaceae bacterium]
MGAQHSDRSCPLGDGASREKFVLCRCGHSKNKPFCDGSHVEAGWRDDEA